MEEIIRILMRRDGMSHDEARRYLKEVREEIAEAIEEQASLEEIEDIIMDNLTLEPDYLIYFL